MSKLSAKSESPRQILANGLHSPQSRYRLDTLSKCHFISTITKCMKRACSTSVVTYLALHVFLSAILLPTISLEAHAEIPQDIREQKLALAVKITGSNPNLCGSGAIIAAGRLITVTHNIESVCPKGENSCPALKLFDSEEQELTTVVPLQGEAIRSLDIAALSGPSIVGMAQGESNLGTPSVDTDVIVAGFPNCKNAEVRAGKVTKVTPLYFEISIDGAFGLSGGAVYGPGGDLLGVVDQAATLSGALSGRLLGGAFNLRAIRADRVFANAYSLETEPNVAQEVPVPSSLSGSLQGRPLIDSIREAVLILDHYRDVVRPIKGFSRLSASGEFLAMVAKFKERLAGNMRLEGDLAQWDSNVSATQTSLIAASLLNTGITSPHLIQLSQQINQSHTRDTQDNSIAPVLLVVAEAAERFGGLREPIGNLNMIDNGAVTEELKDLALAKDNYPGYEVMEASVLLTLGLIAMIWSLTVGYVYGRFRGSRLRRLIVAISVGVLAWPISLLAFVIFGRKMQEIKKNPDPTAIT